MNLIAFNNNTAPKIVRRDLNIRLLVLAHINKTSIMMKIKNRELRDARGRSEDLKKWENEIFIIKLIY